MTMKNFKETKLPRLTKGLIGKYHYGLNIEHAKPNAMKMPSSELVIGRHNNCQ